jgi:hypothetical protein
MSPTMLYLAGAMAALWGIAHLFPTRSVIRGFGEISTDNRRIIAMEWIVEGVALIFVGALVIAATYIDPRQVVSRAVYALSSLVLVALAVVSLFTGFKIRFLPFRLCPLIFGTSAILIWVGGVL